MKINISTLERDTILGWQEGNKARADRYGDGNVAFPDEQMLVAALKKHTGGEINLELNQIMILLSWAEANVDKDFGGGAITNSVEFSVVEKIKKAHAAFALTENAAALHAYEEEVKHKTEPDKQEEAEEPAEPLVTPRWLYFSIIIMTIALVISVATTRSMNAKRAAADASASVTEYQVRYVLGLSYAKHNGVWKKLVISDRLSAGDSVKTTLNSELQFLNGMKISEDKTVVLK